MVCFQIEKKVVLMIIYYSFWLWGSTTTTTFSIHVNAQSDTLKAGDTMNSSITLYSKQRKYYLSFKFRYSEEEGNNYLIIGSTNGGEILWKTYISEYSSGISLTYSGVLKIDSRDREKPIIIYSSPQPINNTVATLLDTGNFVLQQLNPNGSKSDHVLWQSFDYPTHTLMPTMKLGVNRKTGHNWSLVSWLTYSLSTPGTFSLEWDSKEDELNIKKHDIVYWKSGKLRRNGLFENIPKNVQRVYQYIIVSNEEEDSFTFVIKDENYDKFPGWTLLHNGELKSNEGEIGNGDMCYGYNSDKGCQKWEDIPTCRVPGEVFQKQKGSTRYQNITYEKNVSYGYNDCRDICWRNCSCTGFEEFYINKTGCTFYFGNSTQDVYLENDEHFYILVRAKIAPHGKIKSVWICAIIAATILVTFLSILFLAITKKKYRRKEKERKRMVTEMQNLEATNESYALKDLEDDLKEHNIKVFNYTSVLAATMSFTPENKLGEGGYGPVYKGILSTGQEVAIKRLSKTSRQGIEEFKNELKLISELQHKNLVQLLGCCIHEDERILVYEYMSNKSLDFYLFDYTRRMLLDWKKRFNIIEGISQGLLYLHKYSRLKIIHRDLKASNILLDENMNPKISDFGMARMFTEYESIVNTNKVVGTYGYMSPEYAMEGICSTKSDVYSFGVLLLEIISGRRNNSFYDADRPLNLIGYAWELWNDGECLKLMDPSLSDTFISDEVERCIHVGLLCVEQYANDRPPMSDVVSMLTNKSTHFTLPRRPAFYVGSEILESSTTSKVPDSYSINETFTSSKGA